MSDFALNIIFKEENSSEVEVLLKLKNNSEKHYLISSDSIMLDGFLNNKFKILDEANNKLPYKGITAKYIPNYISIEPNEEIQNELNLGDAYSFSNGSYKLFYTTPIMYCENSGQARCVEPDYEVLSGNLVINTINTQVTE